MNSLDDGAYSGVSSNFSNISSNSSVVPSHGSRKENEINTKELWLTKNRLASFLNRKNMFPWKVTTLFSGINAVSSNAEKNHNSQGWNIFSKSEKHLPLSSFDGTSVDSPTGSTGLIMQERPSFLPAKAPMEHNKHTQEYEDIMLSAKKRELKEAKGRIKAHVVQLKQEKQMSETVHIWRNIIPNWISVKEEKFCQELWWHGLPSCVRGKIWKLSIGNSLEIENHQYQRHLTQSEKFVCFGVEKEKGGSDASDSRGFHESNLELINLDVSRTFPHLGLFQSGGPLHDPLKNILLAYTLHQPDIGYVQGMSLLAAMLLLNMDEADAFISFANLICRPLHLSFFSVDTPKIQYYFSTFEELFSVSLPSLSNHLKTLGVSPNMYFLDWVLTIFSRSFGLDVASRLWDLYLRDGESFIFRASIGILKYFENDLLSQDCTAEAAQYLTTFPDDVCIDSLFKNILAVPASTLCSAANFKRISK